MLLMKRQSLLETVGALFLAFLFTLAASTAVRRVVPTTTSAGSLVSNAIEWMLFIGSLAVITLVLRPRHRSRPR